MTQTQTQTLGSEGARPGVDTSDNLTTDAGMVLRDENGVAFTLSDDES